MKPCCHILLGVLCLPLVGMAANSQGQSVGAAANQQLAEARLGTAMYHDVDAAIADGFVSLGLNPEEGVIEYLNEALVDCTLDPAHPEVLQYIESGNGLRLVAVEYVIPFACTSTSTPPEGFIGDADEWRPEADLPIWVLRAWIWQANPDGVFGGSESGSVP